MDLANNRQRIGRWLQTLLLEIGEEYSPRLVLRHIAVNDRQIDVATFGPQKLDDDNNVLGDLVRRIAEAMDTDADGLGGLQRYLLVAAVEDRTLARLPLRCSGLTGGDGADGEPVESEPPTNRGQVAQLMRHNEALMRMFVLGMGQVVSTMQRTIARLQQNSDLADERRLEAVAAAETYLDASHERKLATTKQELEAQTQATAIKGLQEVVSMGLGIYANKGGGHFVKLFQQLADTLSPAQWEKLAALLTDEQSAIFEKMAGARAVTLPPDDGKAPATGPLEAAASTLRTVFGGGAAPGPSAAPSNGEPK